MRGDDIATLQDKLARSRVRSDRMLYTHRIGDSEFVKIKRMVRAMGFTDNFDWVSGVDPQGEELHRVVFAATVNGHRVQCSVSYDAEKLWDSEHPNQVMEMIGSTLRRDVAFHVSLAYREERPFIYQAIAMYHPRLPFFLAYLWWRLKVVGKWMKRHW